MKVSSVLLACLLGTFTVRPTAAGPRSDEAPAWVRSAKSGPWSDAATWQGGKVPPAGSRVQVRAGHVVTYDLDSSRAIRAIHVAGILRFARDRTTRLDVGLIKVQAGEQASEEGFDCDAHIKEGKGPRPALEVGLPDAPINAQHTAAIRLVRFSAHDPKSCPAIVCCGGRMDFHGAPMNRTWVKLGATAKKGDATLTLAEAVTGWRAGDRVIITNTTGVPSGKRKPPHGLAFVAEERTIKAIGGTRLELDAPLHDEHLGANGLHVEVANLSRNVVIESADPKAGRGHTMYHRHSAGSISYAEFRHLGKKDTLGRYPLHFHLCGETMRGSSVIGASIHDSTNRWLTVHGTNYLVVRDCVGYKSLGHGFFLEDGTETCNVLDRNLAVQAYRGQRQAGQALPFDANLGAGFWWANCLNSFTRNVACENNYGFFFELYFPQDSKIPSAKSRRQGRKGEKSGRSAAAPHRKEIRRPIRRTGNGLRSALRKDRSWPAVSCQPAWLLGTRARQR